ncbi:MAG: hypothetical protein ABIP94_00015, partial [Planctomycetota bacterium]
LFAATLLHLKLRPRPRAEAWFARTGLNRDGALSLFRQLRDLTVPPAALHLQRFTADFTLAGRIVGRPSFVDAIVRQHARPEAPAFDRLHLQTTGGGEVLTGIVLPSRLPALLAAILADAPFSLHGGGRFEVALPSPTATDALLAALPKLPVQACIALGAPARGGRGTPLDAGQERLAKGPKHALDPHGVFV